MKKILAASITALICLNGCTKNADMFPLNEAAQQLGPVKATYVDTGTSSGPVKITLGSGEVLKGEYRVAFGSAQGFSFNNINTPYGTASDSSSALVITDGPVQFVAAGPKTQILCRGMDSTMGHGNGECQTFGGALWALSW